MKLKSFFGGSMHTALGLALDELGSDAVLVNSRKAPPEAQHLGEYEVVAASAVDQGAAKPPASGVDATLCQELRDLKRQVEKMRKAVWRSSLSRPTGDTNAKVLAILLEADVDPQLAQEIAACVEARLAGDPLLEAGEDGLLSTLTAELERRFTVKPTLGRPGTQPGVVALVGPPGAGKTTTLAKLAVAGGLKCRRPVQLLSMDTYRIAAIEPLRTYASVLGIGFQALPTRLALEQALDEHRGKELILIDTPGFGPRDADAAAELAVTLAAVPEIDTHLVLPAATNSADLTCAVDRFEIFRPSKLLFARVDETSSLGPAFSQAARTAKPISFLATGQSVPEDLQEATQSVVIERMLEKRAD